MEEEKLHGPPELVEETLPLDEEEPEDKKGSRHHREKLRQYQINRLKYYYAIVDCDSPETANALYEQLNGMEYESSSVRYDLRFVPDDITFEHVSCIVLFYSFLRGGLIYVNSYIFKKCYFVCGKLIHLSPVRKLIQYIKSLFLSILFLNVYNKNEIPSTTWNCVYANNIIYLHILCVDAFSFQKLNCSLVLLITMLHCKNLIFLWLR